MNISFKNIDKNDYSFLKEMMYEAIFVPVEEKPVPQSILDLPEISKYYKNWNETDFGLIIQTNNQNIGAVWCRYFTKENKGYGYISDDIPELSMAIHKDYQNKGFGSILIKEIYKTAKNKGVKSISISVDKRNKAVNFYLKHGFQIYAEPGTDYTMVIYLC